MKKIIAILLAVLPLASAVAQKSSLNVTLKGAAPEVNVVVCEPQAGRLVPVDTITPDKRGRFSLERNSADPVFLALVLTVPQSPMVHVIMLPRERASMEMTYDPDINFLKISNVRGSANMELYSSYTDIVGDVLSSPELQGGLNDRMEQLLRANPNVLMSAFLVTYFETAFEQYASLYKSIRDSLVGVYPHNDFVRHLDDKLRSAVVPGMEAPDIVMLDRDGKTRRLSDLRGKVVLIDFWASWCRPCRAENPNVVRLYNAYKNRGFDIFSVSLDNSRDAWLKAIAADGLVWPNHVSDLRGWSSAGGKLYGINSIPATVLVDREGKVVARNLRGQELERKLKEILGE